MNISAVAKIHICHSTRSNELGIIFRHARDPTRPISSHSNCERSRYCTLSESLARLSVLAWLFTFCFGKWGGWLQNPASLMTHLWHMITHKPPELSLIVRGLHSSAWRRADRLAHLGELGISAVVGVGRGCGGVETNKQQKNKETNLFFSTRRRSESGVLRRGWNSLTCWWSAHLLSYHGNSSFPLQISSAIPGAGAWLNGCQVARRALTYGSGAHWRTHLTRGRESGATGGILLCETRVYLCNSHLLYAAGHQVVHKDFLLSGSENFNHLFFILELL